MSKPIWRRAPSWAKYAAMDLDTEWFWFENKPEWNDEEWNTDTGKKQSVGDRDNAKESLEERP